MVVYVPLIIRDRVTVSKLWVACGESGAGSLDIGLFTASGVQLASSGSQTKPAGPAEYVHDVTDVVIDRGIYYFALVSTTTNSFYQFVLNAPVLTAAGVLQQASTWPLPSSATFAANTRTYSPVGGILTNTVAS